MMDGEGLDGLGPLVERFNGICREIAEYATYINPWRKVWVGWKVGFTGMVLHGVMLTNTQITHFSTSPFRDVQKLFEAEFQELAGRVFAEMPMLHGKCAWDISAIILVNPIGFLGFSRDCADGAVVGWGRYGGLIPDNDDYPELPY